MKHPKILFFKSSIPAGARWITLHPNGPGTGGSAVLVQPNPDGSAHVIGGAGGKLNYLKLRGVKSEADYKNEAKNQKKAKAEGRKAQREKDKTAGITDSKNKAKIDVREQKRKHERDFVGTVGEVMGWDKQELEFNPEDPKYQGLSDKALHKLEQEHHKGLMKRASAAVNLQRQRLVADSSARLAAGIGEIPLDATDAQTLSVQDLSPLSSNSGGLGFSQNFKTRAEQAGLNEVDLKLEADHLKQQQSAHLTDEQRKAAVTRGETAKLVKQELEAIREPVVQKQATAALVDAKQAVDLLRAQKRLKQVQQKAKAATAEINSAAAEPKAFVLEYTVDADEDAHIAADLDGDLRTAQTRAFLSEFEALAGSNPHETLGGHMGVGAYNSINALALAVGGDALIDRSVVDVLGIAGAAQVLARRIHSDIPAEDVQRITEGVQAFHADNYMATSANALAQARELMEAAKAIEVGGAATGADLQVAQELNSRRRNAVTGAQKILGQTLGEMEANAALGVALKQGAKDQWQGSLGKIGIEDAIRRVRALGLQRGDYTLDNVAGDTFLTIHATGLDKLAKPVLRADVEQVQRNLSIINGEHDEEGWLPLGVANRPDLVMDVPAGVAPRLAKPFAPGADLDQSLRNYIGGRAADGDAPGDIVADIQSADFFNQVGTDRIDDYRHALDRIAPLKNEQGKQRRSDELAELFDSYADQWVANQYGGERSTLNRQKFEVNQKSVDALHRALAAHPEGVAAFKQIGDLTHQDQRALREHFYSNVAKESTDAAAMRQDLEAISQNEPEKQVTDMFGEPSRNPEWQDWQQRRNDLSTQINASTLTWAKYVESMGSNAKAYESVQDLIRSHVGEAFAQQYNRANPEAPLKVGKSIIRNNLDHLDTVDPQAREQRMAHERALTDSLRERTGGRYSSGSVADKLDAARNRDEAFNQAQMGFFSTAESPVSAATSGAEPVKLGADERHSLGHVAERQLAGMMDVVGKNFKPGQPTKLWAPSMSGGKNAARQRLVKMIDANKRVVAAFGTGSGKSLLQLAAFTHLQQQGKVKRGLFLVPSIVQGQFSGEALRYLEPGKFNWHIEPGANRASRIAAYKNPDTHFAVMTHQSFRDDMLHLGSKHEGIEESAMSQRLNTMSEAQRKAWMGNIMEKEGIHFDYLTTDESQYTLNRAGKENSGLANVVDALSAHTPYYVTASGDPVKNDASEVFDLMHKMDPDRYNDRGAFLRRYGADTLASKDALRREMARHIYPSKIDPDVAAHRRESQVELSKGQHQALAELNTNFTKARIARMEGRVDVAAMQAISPNSFEGVDTARHEDVAKTLQQSLGIMKSSAIARVINTHPDNPLVNDVAKHARERKGKPGVVFAHNREAVRMLAAKLEQEGHRVVTITGSDSSQEKERKRQMFNPEKGEASADILVASDAGATGMNIQRGQWLYQFDTPMTAMTHAQRNGRIFRTGQKNDVELIDGVANHPEVHSARTRLQTKYGLRDLMTSSMEGLDDTGVASYINARKVAQDDAGPAAIR